MQDLVKVGVLKNGLRFYGQYDSTKTANTSGIGVKCGSVHDPPGQKGMAHFAEHVLTQESRRYSLREVHLLILKHFGSLESDLINIRTTHTDTFYGHNSLYQESGMFECFDLFASLLHPSERLLGKVSAERAAIHAEHHLRGKDVPEAYIDGLLYPTLYTDNPIGPDILGNVTALKEFSSKDVTQFVNERYVPENMFIVMLGPGYHKVRKIAERYFGDWTAAPPPDFDYNDSDSFPRLTETKIVEVERSGIGQHHLAMGFPTETFHTRDVEAIDILALILQVRLYQKLRSQSTDFFKGLYRIYVIPHRTFVHGTITIQFATIAEAGEKHFLRVESAILQEIRKIKQKLVDPREFDAAIEFLEKEYLSTFKYGPNDLCEMVIEAATNGDEELTRLHSFQERLRRVTRRRLRTVANKYFTEHYARAFLRAV